MFGGAKKQRVSCVTGLGGLYYFGGAYFWNITVTEMSHLVDLSKFKWIIPVVPTQTTSCVVPVLNSEDTILCLYNYVLFIVCKKSYVFLFLNFFVWQYT